MRSNEFDDIDGAFQYWVDNIYPGLPSEQKEQYKDTKYLYQKNKKGQVGKKVSERQMLRAMQNTKNVSFKIIFND